jgi:hypothetical protein
MRFLVIEHYQKYGKNCSDAWFKCRDKYVEANELMDLIHGEVV